MSDRASILVVDDDRSARESLADVLRNDGYGVLQAKDATAAFEVISREPGLDLILTDLRMPGRDGIQILEKVHSERPELPVIVMTAFAALETAIEAIGKGAYDYLSKPFRLDHLRMVVGRALKVSALRRENLKLKSVLEEQGETEIIGRSPEMVEVYKLIAKAAPTPATVLIQGESGTGKEVVARLIHKTSRRPGPFLAVNCGGLTESLLESELFGHVKGAFTGATGNKKGVFEAAQGGTCFLDEVSNTTPALQMKLLRVLEEHEITRVGSTQPVPVDARIVAATNQLLAEQVEKGAFREDLYYRLKVVTISLPPLRQRRADIPLLLDYFVKRHAARFKKTLAVHESVYPLLSRYNWPGNVRELENAVERAVTLNATGVLIPDDLPEEIRDFDAPAEDREAEADRSFPTLREKEKDYVLEVLAASGQNVTRAAKILGIDRRTVYRMLKRHHIRLRGNLPQGD